MDETEDPREVEQKIAQVSRIASSITDQTTYERLREFLEKLRAKAKLDRRPVRPPAVGGLFHLRPICFDTAAAQHPSERDRPS